MNRRSFVLALGAIAAAGLTPGCTPADGGTLKVQVLKNSVPPQLLSKFRQQLNRRATLEFTPEAQLNDLYERLLAWKQQENQPAKDSSWNLPFFGNRNQSAQIPDLLTLGDYWLKNAIQQQLIQPLNIEQLSGWQQLESESIAWQELVRRNAQGDLDPTGKIWAAPYRWGTTVIAYRRDKFKSLGWSPTDWADLWRSELSDRISLLDSPREVIGLTLKKLGYSYNTQNLAEVLNLEAQLRQLHQQVKLYSSDAYLQPLLLGDTWLAVGWSTDILPQLQTEQEIEVVIPESGTALWAELWVKPAAPNTEDQSATDSDLAQKWINFCWEPEIARTISLLSKAASPILTGKDPRNELPATRPLNRFILPEAKILKQSEFLLPLPDATLEQYRNLWLKIRRS